MRYLVVHLAGASIGAMLLIASGGEASASGRIEVTITNLTRAQPLSPPVVASHSVNGPQLFVAGQPASAELAGLAEDAVSDPTATPVVHQQACGIARLHRVLGDAVLRKAVVEIGGAQGGAARTGRALNPRDGSVRLLLVALLARLRLGRRALQAILHLAASRA